MTDNNAISQRAARVQPFLVMDMMADAARLENKGRDIIHLEVGQPAWGAPRKVVEAAQNALKSERLGYVDALGLLPLRARISRHYLECYGIDVPVERIVVTTGSSAAFILAFLAAFDVGDKAGLTVPGYPAYRNIMQACGIKAVDIALTSHNGWRPGADIVAGNSDLDGLLLASPANPTGTMLAPDELAGIARACDQHGIRFISDEIYHQLTYAIPQATALAYSSNAIIINSFSKYYCMTGWRIGWMVVPADMVRAIECLSQNLYISSPVLSQHAAIAAFDAGDELEERKSVYAKNRNFLLDALAGIGLGTCTPADGAFYIYADVSRFTNDSAGFCRRMLNEAGVAATTGLDFDPVNGHQHIRMSFAGSLEAMHEAVQRLKAWL